MASETYTQIRNWLDSIFKVNGRKFITGAHGNEGFKKVLLKTEELENSKGQANGLASLDEDGKVPADQLPVGNDKGWFLTEAALIAAYPAGQNGWKATIGETDTIWVWDSDTSAWVDTNISPSNPFGRTYYVDVENGSDTNDGSVFNPFASIEHAISTLSGVVNVACTITSGSNNITGVSAEDIAKIFVGQQIYKSGVTTSSNPLLNTYVTTVSASSFTISNNAVANGTDIDIEIPVQLIIKAGTYKMVSGNYLLKDGVKLHFEQGSTVIVNGSGLVHNYSTQFFDVSITGKGNFVQLSTNTAVYSGMLFGGNAGHVNIDFQFDKIFCPGLALGTSINQYATSTIINIIGNYVKSTMSTALSITNRGTEYFKIVVVESTAGAACSGGSGDIGTAKTTVGHAIQGSSLNINISKTVTAQSSSYGINSTGYGRIHAPNLGTVICSGTYFYCESYISVFFNNGCHYALVGVVNKQIHNTSGNSYVKFMPYGNFGALCDIAAGKLVIESWDVVADYSGNACNINVNGGELLINGVNLKFISGIVIASGAKATLNNCAISTYGNALNGIVQVISGTLVMNGTRLHLARLPSYDGQAHIYSYNGTIILNNCVFTTDSDNITPIAVYLTSTTEKIIILSGGLSMKYSDQSINTGIKRVIKITITAADLTSGCRIYYGASYDTFSVNPIPIARTVIELAGDLANDINTNQVNLDAIATDNGDGTLMVQANDASILMYANTMVNSTENIEQFGSKPYTIYGGGAILQDSEIE